MSARTHGRMATLAAAVAVVALVAASAVGEPHAEAGVGDVVLAPGPLTLVGDDTGLLRIGSSFHPLRGAAALPECSDGWDNDEGQDGAVDFDGGFLGRAFVTTSPDPQCDAGVGVSAATDDNEAENGHQPKTFFSLTGTVDADGSFSAPMSSITFPLDHVYDAIVVDVAPAATGDATGTWDPVGHASLQLDWELRISGSFFGTGGECAAPIAMDLSTDPSAPANDGHLVVETEAPDPHTGSAVLSSNTLVIGPMRPRGAVEGSTGVATAGSKSFTDAGASFQPTDANKRITIRGARADGTDLHTRITSVVDATTVTLATAPGLDVDPASYLYAAADVPWCDSVGSAAGLIPDVGSPAGLNSIWIPVRAQQQLVSGTANGTVSGTVSDAGTGLGIPGVVVTLMAPHPKWTVIETAVTAADGSYAIPGSVNQGDYQLRFFDPSGAHQRAWYGSTLTYRRGSPVPVAGPTTGIDQVLQPVPSGAIAGRVTAGGVARPGTAVRVYHQADGYVAGVITGPDGWYRLRGLPPGSYLVQFVDPTRAHRQQWFRQAALSGDAEPVVVAGETAWASGWLEPVG